MIAADVKAIEGVQAAKDADAKAVESIAKALLPGRRISWMHGEQVRSGEVMEVCGFSLESLRVRVRTNSDRCVMIGFYRIQELIA